jgi:DNA repair protein RadA/Sms
VKNRFGSTNEIGVFEMGEGGLQEVVNPSQTFLEERPIGVSGSVVIASVEGTRPILLEVQSLVTRSYYGVAKRETLGVEYNRVSLLVAVLERKIGLRLWEWDLFVNVTGGMKVTEPAADLGIALSILSSYKDSPMDPRSVAFGEIGLAGEVRAVSKVKERVAEAQRLGFKKCIVPKRNAYGLNGFQVELIGVETIGKAIEQLGI